MIRISLLKRALASEHEADKKWEEMTPAEKQAYVKAHPHTKLKP